MASILNINGRWRALVRRGGQKVCHTFDTEDQARSWAAEEEDRIKHLLIDVEPAPIKGATRYQVAGVYMLMRGNDVRYVGRSVHIYRRLNDHDRKAMEWDSYRIWPCVNSIRAADLERKLIERFQPKLNVALTKATHIAGKRSGKNKDIFTRYVPQQKKWDEAEW